MVHHRGGVSKNGSFLGQQAHMLIKQTGRKTVMSEKQQLAMKGKDTTNLPKVLNVVKVAAKNSPSLQNAGRQVSERSRRMSSNRQN